jgi:hypothetical protein
LGFRVQGLGFRALGSGCRVWGLGFRVEGLGSRVQDLRLGIRVERALHAPLQRTSQLTNRKWALECSCRYQPTNQGRVHDVCVSHLKPVPGPRDLHHLAAGAVRTNLGLGFRV